MEKSVSTLASMGIALPLMRTSPIPSLATSSPTTVAPRFSSRSMERGTRRGEMRRECSTVRGETVIFGASRSSADWSMRNLAALEAAGGTAMRTKHLRRHPMPARSPPQPMRLPSSAYTTMCMLDALFCPAEAGVSCTSLGEWQG